MKARIPIYFAALALCLACNSEPDLGKVTNGMTTAQVLDAIGEPHDKAVMPFGIEWWKYGKNSVVVVDQGVVSRVVLDAKATADSISTLFDGMAEEISAISGRTPVPAGFDMLSPGMSVEEAFTVLGPGGMSRELGNGHTWHFRDGYIVEFGQDLLLKRWMPEQPSLDSALAVQNASQ